MGASIGQAWAGCVDHLCCYRSEVVDPVHGVAWQVSADSVDQALSALLQRRTRHALPR